MSYKDEATKSRSEKLKQYADGGTALRGPSSLSERVSDWMHDRNLPTSIDQSDLDVNPVGLAAVTRALTSKEASPNSRVRSTFDIVKSRTEK